MYVFGGVSMYTALRAMQEALGRPELPLVTANAIFLAPVPPGPVEIDVEVLRDGRNASQVAADVHVPGVRARRCGCTACSGARTTRSRVPGRAGARGPAPAPDRAAPTSGTAEPVRRDPVPRTDRVAAGQPARRSGPRPVRVVGAAAARAAPRPTARSTRCCSRCTATCSVPRSAARSARASSRRWCCRSRSASASSRRR